MKSFSKAARIVLSSVLALCMVFSLVNVSADAAASISFGTATLLQDGYYSQEITVGAPSGDATILIYASNNDIAYVEQGTIVSGTCTFTAELPKGAYTVIAGGTEVTATTSELVLNTAPVFADASYAATIYDNAAAGDVVATVSATDADNDTVVYSVSGDANFTVNGANIVVASAAALSEGTANLIVTASDGVASATAPLTVTINHYIPTYNITAVASIEDVWVRPSDVSAELPATVEVTYDGGKATAAITWDTFELPTVPGVDVNVEGTLELPTVEDIDLQNGNNLKAQATIKLVDESVSMTINGKATATYYNALNTPAEISVTYGNPANAKYAFVVSASASEAAPDVSAYGDSATFTYPGSDEAGVEYVYVFVLDGESVVSDKIAVSNVENTFESGVYVNATASRPTYSAFRVNKNGSLRITGSISDLNGDASGEYVYSVVNRDTGETVLSNATGIFNDLSALSDRTYYLAKITLEDKETEVASAERLFYVAGFSVWFTNYTIDRLPNKSGITLNKTKPVVSSITYDQGNPDTNLLYVNYEITPYNSDSVVAEGTQEEIDTLTYTKELDLSGLANGAYTIYQTAKMDEEQGYNDVKFGKTVYLYDKTALISNILINGSTACALGNPTQVTFKAKWSSPAYEAIAPAGLKYTYEIHKYVGGAYEDEASIVLPVATDNAAVSVDASELAFANKVVLKVELADGTVETAVSKIFYPTLG